MTVPCPSNLHSVQVDSTQNLNIVQVFLNHVQVPYLWHMPRDTLTRDQIVTAAIDLLDAEGLEGLNMRSLGTRLGSAATAVYWHVGSKGDLIALAGESGRLVDGQAVLVMAGGARPEHHQGAECLHQPGVAGEHRVQVGGHGRGGRPPVDRRQVGQRDLAPHLIAGEHDEIVRAAHVPVHRGGR